ncbi:MAG TPA: glycosyltransferase family 1 protein [Vicinamibacterales bacterium]|nr:glycosyltransferase family 1 protein [Vicinamibacterales bacterium]
MRVLYDVSTLGLAHLYEQSRGGAFRAELRLAEGLLASGACELYFCANHSTVAYHGARAFLDRYEPLSRVPLVAPRRAAGATVRTLVSAAHGGVRRLFGSNVLPGVLRRGGRWVDRRLHRPLDDSCAAADILQSFCAPLPPRSGSGSLRRVLTVYDMAARTHPELYADAHRQALSTLLTSVTSEDHLVTCSGFARDELIGAGAAAPERIHVVPLAADASTFHPTGDIERLRQVRRRYAIADGPYALAVNTPDARKNVVRAIHAFAAAWRQAPERMGSLVLTGSPGPDHGPIQRAIAGYPALHGRIVLTGYVPDADLAPLYTGARFFVCSSLYEGFGLPPLEAMQCGTPVVASNTSSLPEVVGDAGILVPPEDVGAIGAAMLALACNDQRHAGFRSRALSKAREFSWETSVARLLEAYRAALGAAPAQRSGHSPIRLSR